MIHERLRVLLDPFQIVRGDLFAIRAPHDGDVASVFFLGVAEVHPRREHPEREPRGHPLRRGRGAVVVVVVVFNRANHDRGVFARDLALRLSQIHRLVPRLAPEIVQALCYTKRGADPVHLLRLFLPQGRQQRRQRAARLEHFFQQPALLPRHVARASRLVRRQLVRLEEIRELPFVERVQKRERAAAVPLPRKVRVRRDAHDPRAVERRKFRVLKLRRHRPRHKVSLRRVTGRERRGRGRARDGALERDLHDAQYLRQRVRVLHDRGEQHEQPVRGRVRHEL
eukprot:29339-Pelagococcus_subviridis.AAC.6